MRRRAVMGDSFRLDGGLAEGLRPGDSGASDIASLIPTVVGPGQLHRSLELGDFPLWYTDTVLLCGGILAVQW